LSPTAEQKKNGKLAQLPLLLLFTLVVINGSMTGASIKRAISTAFQLLMLTIYD